MVFVLDKLCNYIIYIFLIHFCWRISIRKNPIFILASFSTVALAGVIDNYYGESYFAVYIVWCLFAVILLFEDSIIHLGFLTLGLTWFMGVLDTFSVIVSQIIMIGSANNRSGLEYWQLSAYLISFLIEFLWYYLILKKNNVYMDNIRLISKMTILIMAVVFEMVIVNVYGVYYKNPSDYNLYLHFRFGLSLFGAIYAITATLKLAVKNYLYDSQNKDLKLALDIQKDQYQYQKENNLNLRRFRHDLINHIGAIQELLSSKQYSSAMDYINNIWDVTNKLSSKIATGDDYLDAILNYYNYACEKESIAFKVSGRLNSPFDNIDILDITTLFGNALQNAVEATKQVENRAIIVEIVDKQSEIFVSIHNTCHQLIIPSNQKLTTSKKDKINHGFGLNNIFAVIKKYSGEYYITVDSMEKDYCFKLDISLPRGGNNNHGSRNL